MQLAFDTTAVKKYKRKDDCICNCPVKTLPSLVLYLIIYLHVEDLALDLLVLPDNPPPPPLFSAGRPSFGKQTSALNWTWITVSVCLRSCLRRRQMGSVWRERDDKSKGRMGGKKYWREGKKPWAKELIERMQLFLVVIHSNVFTWLGRPEIWVETERRGVAGIIHLMKGAFSQPVCFWDWNLYKLDQQVGYFPLLFQFNLPTMPHVPKVPGKNKVHTANSHTNNFTDGLWTSCMSLHGCRREVRSASGEHARECMFLWPQHRKSHFKLQLCFLSWKHPQRINQVHSFCFELTSAFQTLKTDPFI